MDWKGKKGGNLNQGVNFEAMAIRQDENEKILVYGSVMGESKGGGR